MVVFVLQREMSCLKKIGRELHVFIRYGLNLSKRSICNGSILYHSGLRPHHHDVWRNRRDVCTIRGYFGRFVLHNHSDFFWASELHHGVTAETKVTLVFCGLYHPRPAHFGVSRCLHCGLLAHTCS